MKSPGESGKNGSPSDQGKMEMGQQPPGGKNGQLAQRQQELRDKLQSLIDRFRMEGADAPEQFDGAKEIDERRQAGDRRGQSRPGH